MTSDRAKAIAIAAAAGLAACFARSASGQLTETIKLTATDAAAMADFGSAVELSGELAIVGARDDNAVGDFSGSAYLFNVATGQQLFKWVGSDTAAGDGFGFSAAIDGSMAIIGAPFKSDVAFFSGAAYVFDAATGQQLFKFEDVDPEDNDQFGTSVAVSGTIAVVGSPFNGDVAPQAGALYVFDLTTGQQLFKLTASDGTIGDRLGSSVAISGTTIIAGAPRDNVAGSASGSAYLFDASTGQQIRKIAPSDGRTNGWFGFSVAVDGTTAIVGSYDVTISGPDTGSAYVFNTASGQQLFKLTPPNGGDIDQFGRAVAISGSNAVVGSPGRNEVGQGSGAAFIYNTQTGDLTSMLLSSDLASEDFFGGAVGISGARSIVGAFGDDDQGSFTGAAYIFGGSSPCPGDIADDFGTLGGDGMVSFGDFLALLGLVGPCAGGTPGCDGDIADDFGTLNGGDGQVSFGDFLALLGLVGPCT